MCSIFSPKVQGTTIYRKISGDAAAHGPNALGIVRGSDTIMHNTVFHFKSTNLQVHNFYGCFIAPKQISGHLSNACIHTFEQGRCFFPVAARFQAICTKVTSLASPRPLAVTEIQTNAISGVTRGGNFSIGHGSEGLHKLGRQ